MLATLAALQLLVLAQSPAVDPYPLPPPADTAQPPGANPPLPSKPRRGEPAPAAPRPALPADTEPPPPPPPPATPPPAPQAPSQAPAQAEAAATPYRAAATATSQLSLLGAEPLSGGSAVLVEAGWSSIGAYYGQGITRTDDLGALATYDWAKTELRLGGFYRRPIGVTGAFDVAGRLSLAWYNDFGKSWVYSENHRDHGLEIAPALILSTRAATGILSITAEAPITITLRHDSGLLFSPRLSVGYEVPLYDGLTLGGRAGLGYRGGSGDAPLSSSRGELTFLIVGGYRLF